MPKRRISAKEAVADIRSGMSDAAVMKKFSLSEEGLQSLYDKLVQAGFIDLAEVQGRLRGYFGTVVISESAVGRIKREQTESRQVPKTRSAPVINAQEAARDVRSLMDDEALMEKYRLSRRSLDSLLTKLTAAGLVTQADLDRRRFGIDHTVDLREETLDFGDALAKLGLDRSQNPTAIEETGPQLPTQITVTPEIPRREATSQPRHEQNVPIVHSRAQNSVNPWYDKPPYVVILLIVLFPLGLYGLYRNSTFSGTLKVVILASWFILASACLLFISGMTPAWPGLW
jgi:hypothetical protein